MEKNIYIDSKLEDLVPGFIKDRNKDMADIRKLLTKKAFDEILEILKVVWETTDTFGFVDASKMAKLALTAAKKKNIIELGDILADMENHFKKAKIVYIDFNGESEFDYYGNGGDRF